MRLSTTVAFPQVIPKLGFEDGMVFMGSCFSEYIGGWMAELRFLAAPNITGIVYNPISIARHLDLAVGEAKVDFAELKQNDALYVHTDFHSRFNHTNRGGYIAQIEATLNNLRSKLTEAKTLFITFGTAIAFEEKHTGRIANNCHKLPAAYFEKRYLDEGEMAKDILGALDALTVINPTLNVVLTISPVRHLRHGAAENQRSKARLIRLCEMLCEARANCTYLPIYEYVIDELRDYRYYRHDDLVHLSELGLELVRDKVRTHLIDPDATALLRRIQKWKTMKSHKIMQGNTPSSLNFKKKLVEETQALESILPGRFTRELSK